MVELKAGDAVKATEDVGFGSTVVGGKASFDTKISIDNTLSVCEINYGPSV